MENQLETQNSELNNEMAQRLAKLDEIRKNGIAFPNDFRRDHISSDLHSLYDDKDPEALEAENSRSTTLVTLSAVRAACLRPRPANYQFT